jgi:hypothetical protein
MQKSKVKMQIEKCKLKEESENDKAWAMGVFLPI